MESLRKGNGQDLLERKTKGIKMKMERKGKEIKEKEWEGEKTLQLPQVKCSGEGRKTAENEMEEGRGRSKGRGNKGREECAIDSIPLPMSLRSARASALPLHLQKGKKH